jgi:hypothetical protein
MTDDMQLHEPSAPQTTGKPLPRAVLTIGVGGVFALVGSLLPWVTIASILSISGVSARWGLIPLVAGLLLVAIAIQLATGKLVAATANRALAIVGIVLGVLSLATSLYVGFAIRDAVAESKSETSASEDVSTGDAEMDAWADEFAKGLEELFEIGTGIGVYVTGLGGLLGAGGSALAVAGRREVD